MVQCANEAKTLDMIQSTLPNSAALFIKTLTRVTHFFICLLQAIQLLYLLYIFYFCLHGPLRYFSHSVKCLALLLRISNITQILAR